MPKAKAKLQLDEGLIIPLGAASGYVLTSDSSGNGTWQPSQTASAGRPGNLYSGVGLPPANVGVVGDYWLDTATLRLYGPKGTTAASPLNLHPNPSVEADVTGWTSSASAGGPATVRERTQDWSAHGTWSYHVSIGRIPAANCVVYTCSGTSGVTVGKVPVDPAKVYSYLVYHRLRALTSVTPQIRPYVYWWKADGTASAISTATAGIYQPAATGDVLRLAWLGIAPPSDAAWATPAVYGATVDVWDSDTDGVVWVEGSALPVEWPAAPLGRLLQITPTYAQLTAG